MSLEATYCAEVRKSRYAFLKQIEPHRPDLFRYCRSLTRTPWDAEDLVQETIAKAFAKLGEVWLDGINHPRAGCLPGSSATTSAQSCWLRRGRH